MKPAVLGFFKAFFEEMILRKISALLRLIRIALLLLVLCPVGLAALLRYVDPPCTPLMLWRWAAGEGMQHHWRDLGVIAPVLQQAVMAAEDQQFRDHFGFDLDQIEKALKENRHRRSPRGASTITMQTARNLFLWQGGGYVRKGLEAYFTVLLEIFCPKWRIMELYLNIAEWGPGFFGAEAASKAYFGRPAARLTHNQAALMAAVLPNPRRWSPARPTDYIIERAAEIDQDMRNFAPLAR